VTSYRELIQLVREHPGREMISVPILICIGLHSLHRQLTFAPSLSRERQSSNVNVIVFLCILWMDFTYNRMCMKLFKSSNVELIKECQCYFRRVLPSLAVKERCQKFN